VHALPSLKTCSDLFSVFPLSQWISGEQTENKCEGISKKWDASCSFQKMKPTRGVGVPSFDILHE
jgi:hypothetical protein